MKAIFVLTFVLSSAFFAVGQKAGVLAPSLTVSLPLVQGGFNHMSVDAARQRLFVAAPTNKTLEVVDIKSGKLLQSLDGERPAAALYAPEFNQLYVSRGQGVSIYDGETLNLIASVDLQTNPDEMHYDPRAKELYVGCMGADKTGIAIIAIPEGKLLAKISLPGKPQGFVVEQNGSRIFANLPDQKMVAVIDRKKHLVLQPWPLQDVQGNTPIALDEAHHRLFVGARRPATLLVLDTSTGKQVAAIGIDGDTDDIFYDPANRRIYVSCGEGFVDVIQQVDANHYRSLGRIVTISGARTSTLSAQLNKFFLGVPRRADQPAEIRVFDAAK
jgi:DNA-binding beta-propeller fold protein YncE